MKKRPGCSVCCCCAGVVATDNHGDRYEGCARYRLRDLTDDERFAITHNGKAPPKGPP